MSETFDTLTVDADGWLVNGFGQRIAEPIATPVVGCYPAQEFAAQCEASQRLGQRIERGNLSPSQEKALFFDSVTAPDGQRFYTARVGRPVNEAEPRTLRDEVFAS